MCVCVINFPQVWILFSPCNGRNGLCQGALSLQNTCHLLRQLRGGRHQDTAWVVRCAAEFWVLKLMEKSAGNPELSRKKQKNMDYHGKNMEHLEESSSYLRLVEKNPVLQVLPWLDWDGPKVPHQFGVVLDILRIGADLTQICGNFSWGR